MKKKFSKKEKEIFEYKITFRVDNNSQKSRRHFLAHDAKEALNFFAHSVVRSLNLPNLSSDDEILLGNSFVQKYIQDSGKQEFRKTDSNNETDEKSETNYSNSEIPRLIITNNTPTTSNDDSLNPLQFIPENVLQAMTEMVQRVEIIRFEEYNRWANRWFTLLVPLEEISDLNED